MKKAIREWAFNLFTKRITVKVANLPNEAKIEYLVNKLMNEMVAQGYDIKGCGCDYVVIYGHKDETVRVGFINESSLEFKRLRKV